MGIIFGKEYSEVAFFVTGQIGLKFWQKHQSVGKSSLAKTKVLDFGLSPAQNFGLRPSSA